MIDDIIKIINYLFLSNKYILSNFLKSISKNINIFLYKTKLSYKKTLYIFAIFKKVTNYQCWKKSVKIHQQKLTLPMENLTFDKILYNLNFKLK